MPLRLPATKGHKYRAKPLTIDGIRFASTKEANRYLELRLLEQIGEISRVSCQPSFDLYAIDVTSVRGKLKHAAAHLGQTCCLDALAPVKVGRYVADFAYWTKDDTRVIEDVKGMKTALYKWKKKHVEAQYGIRITEV